MIDDDKLIAEIESRHAHSLSACRRCLGFGEIAHFGQMVACDCRSKVMDEEKRVAIEDRAALLAIVRRQQSEITSLTHQCASMAESFAGAVKVNNNLRERQAAFRDGLSHPNDIGQYVGDTWFGHPEDRTLPTHWWNGDQWVLDYTPPRLVKP